ncbi:ribonuclease P protein subunit [Candidatus Woesearchaeota archaeon]|nr:ribonuclease P protein subunit [Candidatus Woesearchaeota archaeon]
MRLENKILIGKKIKIIEAKNKALIGIEGKVQDETKNMLILENKKLIKDQVTIKISDNNKEYIIKGKNIRGKAEERIKK